MITKEKHFTKCETPNSSRIIEDKKHNIHHRLTNGVTEPVKDFKRVTNQEVIKTEKSEEVKSVPDVAKTNGTPEDIVKRETGSDEAAVSYNAPKYGTVIPNRIFVGGFLAKTADEDLWRFFSTISEITAAKIIYDRAGVSKCYGFVTFANPKDSRSIVKQTGGVMFSPMGRLRIAQAVRKQVPQYQNLTAEFAHMGPLPPPPHDGFYPASVCHPKNPMCLAYPAPLFHYPKVPLHHHPGAPRSSPHGSTAASSESGQPPVHQHATLPAAANPSPNPAPLLHHHQHQHQHHQAPNNNHHVHHQGNGGALTAASPHYEQNGAGGVYHASPLLAHQSAHHPAYVLNAVPYPGQPTAMPAYDATGLYTTCPGYTPALPYPYVVLQPAPREAAYQYHHHHHGGNMPPSHILNYGPPPQAACYPHDAKLPLVNYIY